MSATKFKFTLQRSGLIEDNWEAWLSDGVQEAIINASFRKDLGALVGPVHLLLWGASDGWCSWMDEPGEYRWLFSRQDEKLSIHVLWFKEYLGHLDNNQGETVLRMECDLLTFAKRLFQQLNQLDYQEDPSAPLSPGLQNLQASIKAYEQAKHEQQRKVLKRGKNQ